MTGISVAAAAYAAVRTGLSQGEATQFHRYMSEKYLSNKCSRFLATLRIFHPYL
jgi:hypothetical protein